MTYEEALRKAAACLRLAKSSNPNEAALAAAKAQEIMDRYNITIAASDLEAGRTSPEEAIQRWDHEPVITACQKDKQWTIRLTVVVAGANGCKCFMRNPSGGADMYLIGRASDVQTARYMIGLLAGEVRRLNREHCLGYSDKYRRDFKYGVVDAIAVKLRSQWEATKVEAQREATTSTALVRVNQALAKMEKRLEDVEAWEKENMSYRKSGTSHYRTDANARHHGFQAGQTIEINRARGAVGSGQKSISQ